MSSPGGEAPAAIAPGHGQMPTGDRDRRRFAWPLQAPLRVGLLALCGLIVVSLLALAVWSMVVAGVAATSAVLLALATLLLRQIRRRELSDAALRRERDGLERLVGERTKALALGEARHRDVAEVASDWFWEIDAQGRFAFVSSRFEQLAGLAAADILGRSFDDLARTFNISGEERDEFRHAMAARAPFANICLRVTPPEGPARLWLTSGKPFVDPESGDFAGYRGTGTDVTAIAERELALTRALRRAKAAEDEVETSRARLLDAIKVIPAGFALWDADDRLVLCNEHYRELYVGAADLIVPGIGFEDLVRQAIARGLYALGDQDPDQWIADRIALHRAPDGVRVERQHADGRWISSEDRRTADGGVVGIRVDVSEAHRRETVERERQKLTALGQLAGGVAHEINNLLQPVLTLPAQIEEQLPADAVEARGDLTEIVDSARRMREIVRNILLFARQEGPTLVPLDPAIQVKTVLAFVGKLLPPSVTLRQALPPAQAPPMVAANQTQLTQVLTNLVVNAAQAMADHGTITVALGEERPSAAVAQALAIDPGRSYVVVTVADTGSGMDADTQRRIFEPFFTTKPVGQGTGLGLSVVYGILRSWQGAIAVASAPGKGTTFSLYIPALADAAAPAAAAQVAEPVA